MQDFSDISAKINAINESKGNLELLDCPLCKNKGYIAVEHDGNIITRKCECVSKRASLKRLKNSGLIDLAESYCFGTFEEEQPWQSEVKGKAAEFVSDPSGRWFVITGSPGIGKTHICTAIVTSLIDAGKNARYMLWREVAPRLKALVNERSEYEAELNDLKKVDVLYIDDFLKGTVTDADINLAFDLINTRYNARKKTTIISSERSIKDMMDIDMAMGSRINERSRGFRITLGSRENYRLK